MSYKTVSTYLRTLILFSCNIAGFGARKQNMISTTAPRRRRRCNAVKRTCRCPTRARGERHCHYFTISTLFCVCGEQEQITGSTSTPTPAVAAVPEKKQQRDTKKVQSSANYNRPYVIAKRLYPSRSRG